MIICIIIAAFFACLAVGLNDGSQFDELPNIALVGFLGVTIIFGIIASRLRACLKTQLRCLFGK